MSNLSKYVWPVLIAIYIISPFDAHPLFLDDLIAAGWLFYILYKNSKQKQHQQQYYDNYRQSQSTGRSQQETEYGSNGPLTLDGAYSLLGVDKNSSMDEIGKAYREKMTKSHPDKVSHLSEELQEKAEEISLKLNDAYDLVKRHRKG